MRALVLTLLLALPASARAAQRVVYVDNRGAAGGNGTIDRPYATLAEAARNAHDFDVIFVAETDQPYLGGLTLSRGQMLIGSAYGLDAVRSELHVELPDAPPTPAARGAGPVIAGVVVALGDNTVAGVTAGSVVVDNPTGPVTVIDTWVRPSRNTIGVAIGGADVAVKFSGGGLQGKDDAFGLSIGGGRGDVTFDRFPIGGQFSQVIGILNRAGGQIAFRGRLPIDASASNVGMNVADCEGSVVFEVPLRLTARRRAAIVSKSAVKIAGGASRLSSAEGNALEIRDARVDAAFEDVSAAAGGIVVDKLHGALAISGGTVAKTIDITQSDGARLTNMTAGALHLRHVAHAALEEITLGGGMRVSNIEDVTFGALHAKGAVALDEAKGTVKFNRCTFEDAVEITEQFNSAKVSFANCVFSGPSAALHTRASAGVLSMSITDTRLDAPIVVAGDGSARVALRVGRTTAPSVDVSGSACAQLFGNAITAVHLAPAVTECQ